MSKQSGKRAAGLAPTAKAEKKRLRPEGIVFPQEHKTEGRRLRRSVRKSMPSPKGKLPTYIMVASDALGGVVALVDLGPESRAKALRATLTALGATVAPLWSPLVTHVVWSEGGCRDVRARARALGAQVVSPLWVEACAIAQERLPENTFPAAPRPSDLPSPRQMQQALKKAELDNIPLDDLLNSSAIGTKNPKPRGRSAGRTAQKTADTSESSNNTPTVRTRAMTRSASKATASVTSTVTSSTPSMATTTAGDSTEVENGVNTAPRRALPLSMTPPEPIPKPAKKPEPPKRAEQPKPPSQPEPQPQPAKAGKQPKKSKRKLFKQPVLSNTESEPGPSVSSGPVYVRPTPSAPPEPSAPPARVERPIRAVRAAAAAAARARAEPPATTRLTQRDRSGLERAERIARRLHDPISMPRPDHKYIYSREWQYQIVLTGMAASERRLLQRACRRLGGHLQDEVDYKTTHVLLGSLSRALFVDQDVSEITNTRGVVDKILSFEHGHLRTLNALLGAARGCRVLYANWVYESLKAYKWVHHFGYEVPYYKNISQKAYIERHAFGLLRSEFGFDVFEGRRICVTNKTEKRDCVEQLLALCGAIIFNEYGEARNRTMARKMRLQAAQVSKYFDQEGAFFKYDAIIGTAPGQIASKWVFDCVVSTRMRSTRRYMNPAPESTQNVPE
ncbi:DNA topoisomerase 2-binding protein 1-like isoform X2 [Pectinophora gossypiella]|uniref:DNA topoisomerase 2-binding protein 1-like isoform X2 n=1 Tax=Pectinophora gossypiella TaxID=13191 RepID=UPI00214F22B1|nr:DNA topoisomerase 2-binding protein 1-like isoform X2 [Pectinophora gossypiella]